MMKLLVFAAVVLQLANNIAAQCVAPFQDVNGQCMICSSNIPAVPATDSYANARTTCANLNANIATVINSDQEIFADACGTTPWIGYTNLPFPMFLDGTLFVPFGLSPSPPAVSQALGCYQITALGDWDDLASCAGPFAYSCSKPYNMCPVVEVQAPLSVMQYAHTDTSVPPTNYKWEQTVVTYKCATGFTMVGAAIRTCQTNGMWSDSEPACIHTGVCTALTQADHSMLTYSPANPAGNGMYSMGTVATQMCATGYEKEGGTYTRTCQAGNIWTGSMIVCNEEDDDDNALALGLGLGLGALALVGLGLLLWCCLCRPRGPGMSAPPPVRPYPRGVRRGYPLPRGYPRRVY